MDLVFLFLSFFFIILFISLGFVILFKKYMWGNKHEYRY